MKTSPQYCSGKSDQVNKFIKHDDRWLINEVLNKSVEQYYAAKPNWTDYVFSGLIFKG